jgi:hypothetical protein
MLNLLLIYGVWSRDAAIAEYRELVFRALDATEGDHP